jgi:hypothetical protein
MLLTDLPITTPEEAWEKVQWYCRRWGIEEWHRALKNGCGVEQREFKTAEHLERVLAFDLVVAWRVLALSRSIAHADGRRELQSHQMLDKVPVLRYKSH